MPQVSLYGFFTGSPSKLAEDPLVLVDEPQQPEREVEQIVAETPTKGISQEVALQQHCQEVGQEFVKNGSRDRWGNLRSNVGGRPKKTPRSSDLEGPVDSEKVDKSNRKRAGGGGGGGGGGSPSGGQFQSMCRPCRSSQTHAFSPK